MVELPCGADAEFSGGAVENGQEVSQEVAADDEVWMARLVGSDSERAGAEQDHPDLIDGHWPAGCLASPVQGILDVNDAKDWQAVGPSGHGPGNAGSRGARVDKGVQPFPGHFAVLAVREKAGMEFDAARDQRFPEFAPALDV